MKPPPFEYLAPDTVDDALAALAEHGYDAKILAGGQSLIPSLNFRLTEPAVLIDINRLSSLASIMSRPDGGLTMGAMTRQRTLERSDEVRHRAPLLAETVPLIAHPQIRNRGTLGGSLAHADPAAELPVVAVVREATITVRSRRGSRSVRATDFFVGMFTVDLEPDEMLIEIEWPAWPARSGGAFEEVARRHGDYALAGVAAVVSLDDDGRCRDVRLGFLNLGDGPLTGPRAAAVLRGEKPSDDAIAAAANLAAAEEIDPIGTIHATADFQRHLARVLTGRALRTAVARAENAV